MPLEELKGLRNRERMREVTKAKSEPRQEGVFRRVLNQLKY